MKGPKMSEELFRYVLKYSRGDAAVLLCLIAIYGAEQGRKGLEMGVMDPKADTTEKQARWAANTVRSKERMYRKLKGNPRGEDNLFTDDFIEFFSSKYAPVGAKNDPMNLNVHHAKNMKFFYKKCKKVLRSVV